MPCGQRRAQTEFTRQYTGSYDACELACVVAGRGLVGATHAEEVEHGGLRREEGAASDCADFD